MPPLKAQLLLAESLAAYFPEMVFTDSGITVQIHRNTQLFQGVTLDSRMGYTGKRQFHGLGQAINWAKSSVGYSWSNKHFHKPVDLDLLLACTASKLPEHLVEDLKRRGN
ncbi:hypothetical protein N8Q20_21475 [Enterobacter hormaechei subsp. steigerwaltii]|nr:hypothetical protein [Enterobacter hormaechei subsp. steigerwaltii]